jgi:hypothetical protein
VEGKSYKWNGPGYDANDDGPAVPAWANYLVVNPDGSVWALTHRPVFGNGEWRNDDESGPSTRASCLWKTFGAVEMPYEVASALLVDLRWRTANQ